MDPYATHQRALIAAALITSGPIVEMGCGDYSTPLLYEIAKSQNRDFTVYSIDIEWAKKYQDYVNVIILESWKDFPYPENTGLTFVDQKEYVRDRKLHVPRLLETSDVVVCHDMVENEWNAKWCKSFIDTPPTIMLSNKQEVYQELPKATIEKQLSKSVIATCVYKTGGDYTAEYVWRLYADVIKYSERDIDFVVYTDSDETMPGKVIKLQYDLPGWWSKLELFREFNGRTVFFDLDTIITGSLEELYDYDGPIALISDYYDPKILSTSVMAWNSPLQFLIPTQEEKEAIFRNPGAWDQHYIVRKLNDMKWNIDVVQDFIKLVSYKVHCMENGVPPETKIVCFHGKPRPHEIGWKL